MRSFEQVKAAKFAKQSLSTSTSVCAKLRHANNLLSYGNTAPLRSVLRFRRNDVNTTHSNGDIVITSKVRKRRYSEAAVQQLNRNSNLSSRYACPTFDDSFIGVASKVARFCKADTKGSFDNDAIVSYCDYKRVNKDLFGTKSKHATALTNKYPVSFVNREQSLSCNGDVDSNHTKDDPTFSSRAMGDSDRYMFNSFSICNGKCNHQLSFRDSDPVLSNRKLVALSNIPIDGGNASVTSVSSKAEIEYGEDIKSCSPFEKASSGRKISSDIFEFCDEDLPNNASSSTCDKEKEHFNSDKQTHDDSDAIIWHISNREANRRGMMMFKFASKKIYRCFYCPYLIDSFCDMLHHVRHHPEYSGFVFPTDVKHLKHCGKCSFSSKALRSHKNVHSHFYSDKSLSHLLKNDVSSECYMSSLLEGFHAAINKIAKNNNRRLETDDTDSSDCDSVNSDDIEDWPTLTYYKFVLLSSKFHTSGANHGDNNKFYVKDEEDISSSDDNDSHSESEKVSQDVKQKMTWAQVAEEARYDLDLQKEVSPTSLFKRFCCHRCPYAVDSKCEFERHLELHGSRQRCVCSYCDYSCPNVNLLRNHERLHSTVSKMSSWGNLLLRFQPVSALKDIPSLPNNVLVAARKHLNFPQEQVLAHLRMDDFLKSCRRTRQSTGSSRTSPNGILSCPFCPFVVYGEENLTEHMEMHCEDT